MAIGDTVTVDGETSSAPIPLPVSLTAAVAACQGSANAAAASATAASNSATSAASIVASAIAALDLGSASKQASTAFDPAGSAATAQTAAESFTTAQIAALATVLNPAQLAALQAAVLATLPQQSAGGAVPVATGSYFVNSSGFVVKAQ